jgi:lysozyme
MDTSNTGLRAITAHEGLVLNAYLDPVGVVTIGYGFTNRSRVFLAWAKTKWGRPMRLGDRITKSEADNILRRLLDEEYEPFVINALDGKYVPQHVFDACVSVVYNLGPRALKWKWFKAVKAGDLVTASARLRNTGTTASGQRLRGLVNRRKAEARMLMGQQEDLFAQRDKTEIDVTEAQEGLKRLGFDPGVIDGIMGTNTRAAVKAYQNQHPHLVADGIIGPATLTQIRKDLKALKEGAKNVGAVGAVTAVVETATEWPTDIILAGGAVVAVAVLAFTIWRYRDVLRRKIVGVQTGRQS